MLSGVVSIQIHIRTMYLIFVKVSCVRLYVALKARTQCVLERDR